MAFLSVSAGQAQSVRTYRRVVILKVDGLNGDLLMNTIAERDPASGKSRLPWFARVFDEQGVVFKNFYARGISLSAPSWSMLDTGRHAIIRGNVEYDRYTGHVYDYLNMFPFYLLYARKSAVDMPGVEVLDRAGIPLLIDSFHYDGVLQGFQLFQRGVSWVTLRKALLRTFSGKALFSMAEATEAISASSSLSHQLEDRLLAGLKGSTLLYLDLYSSEADHEGHATNDPSGLERVMTGLDIVVGQIWTAIQASPLAQDTLFVVVSDHGMNNTPGIISQTFSLPDLLNSAPGGAHHVVTDREQLSEFKLKGINPLVHRVVTPSRSSFYLKDKASQYPTAWLDIDGNERAALSLRNNDLNKLQVLLLALDRRDLPGGARRAAAQAVRRLIDKNRGRWVTGRQQLTEELAALQQAIDRRKEELKSAPGQKSGNANDQSQSRLRMLRLRREMQAWEDESEQYRAWCAHLGALLSLRFDADDHFHAGLEKLIPPMALGDRNSVADLQHYVVGPSADGLALNNEGELDEERSFRYVDYFSLLSEQRVRNNPQARLSNNPIDFTAMRLPEAVYAPGDNRGHTPQQAYFLYADRAHELIVVQDGAENLRLLPVHDFHAADGPHPSPEPWQAGLPLRLFEDPELQIPPGAERADWLSEWHTEAEWMEAVHRCRYSNGVIGITETLSPIGRDVPGRTGEDPLLIRYEKHRRQLVESELQIFAADHWNFNVRFPNPGGNHGGFLRISTHSVWMMAGAGLPREKIERPYDSLNFASTILQLAGKTPPMPERAITLR